MRVVVFFLFLATSLIFPMAEVHADCKPTTVIAIEGTLTDLQLDVLLKAGIIPLFVPESETEAQADAVTDFMREWAKRNGEWLLFENLSTSDNTNELEVSEAAPIATETSDGDDDPFGVCDSGDEEEGGEDSGEESGGETGGDTGGEENSNS